jgi:microcystin-dependent protein
MDHNVGVTAEFVFTRTDLNEANFAVSKTVGAVTNIGDLLYADAPNSLARLAKGTSGLALVAGATTPGYAALTATGLAADSVTATQIAAGAVGVSELAAAVQAMLVPPGVMVAYGGTAEPTGWLFANAQTVSRTTYAALFAIYGTTYNTGGEAGTDFRMPDLRGRVLVGMDNLGGTTDAGRLSVTNTMGGSGGAQTVTLTSTEMPAHTHVQDVHTHIQNSHNHTQEQHAHRVSLFPIAIQTGSTSFDFQITAGNWAASGALPATDAQIAVNQAALAVNQNATAVNQSTGSGGAHDNMPPYQLCNILVKT